MIAVGIDVSKSKSTIAIVDSSGEILMKPTDFMHNESSFSHLATILHSSYYIRVEINTSILIFLL